MIHFSFILCYTLKVIEFKSMRKREETLTNEFIETNVADFAENI